MSGYTSPVLYMVIERFKDGNTGPIGARFRERGRLMPEGVSYVASFVDPESLRCFQVMDAESRQLLDVWIDNWNDLVDFEVVPVITSAQFWGD